MIPPLRMLRGFARTFILLTALTTPARTAPSIDVKLPPGTRSLPDGSYLSSRGLRDATDFIAKQLAARGITADQIGPYRIRGIELTRFVSQSPSTQWLAIHILRSAGKTLIFFVPRPKP